MNCRWFQVEKKGMLSSLFAEHEAKVFYKKDCWSAAPDWLLERGYGLTYFQSSKEAEDYVYGFVHAKNAQLWRVSIRGQIKVKPLARLMVTYRDDLWTNRDLFFRYMEDFKDHEDVGPWPWGTCLAARIKPIEPLANWEAYPERIHWISYGEVVSN